MLYRIVAILLFPAIFYDGLTSFAGTAAFFNLRPDSGYLLWGLPLFITITAVVINFVTYDIFEDVGSGDWIRLFWFICIVFDLYTALLGITNIKFGGDIFYYKITNMFDLKDRLTVEECGVLMFGAVLVVVSPMFCFWLIKKGSSNIRAT